MREPEVYGAGWDAIPTVPGCLLLLLGPPGWVLLFCWACAAAFGRGVQENRR